VHAVLATGLGIPLMTKVEATLSGQNSMPGQNGQTVTVTAKGDVSSVQLCKPLPDDGRAPADVPVPPEKRFAPPPDGGRPGGQVNPLKPRMPTVAFQKTAEPREGAFTFLYSLEINPQWWAGEQKGVDDRSKIVMNTQRDIARMDREIADNRRRTMDRINTDHYLVLTDQNDYVNPHTGAVERDTNAWNHRWVSPNGEVVYTDNSNYNPNEDVSVARHDYQLSAPRR
jgi:hypothetical protein